MMDSPDNNHQSVGAPTPQGPRKKSAWFFVSIAMAVVAGAMTMMFMQASHEKAQGESDFALLREDRMQAFEGPYPHEGKTREDLVKTIESQRSMIRGDYVSQKYICKELMGTTPAWTWAQTFPDRDSGKVSVKYYCGIEGTKYKTWTITDNGDSLLVVSGGVSSDAASSGPSPPPPAA